MSFSTSQADAEHWPNSASHAAVRLRGLDWASHPLGPPTAWPAALRTAIDLLLPAPVGMGLLWGEDHVLFYNDAMAPLLGERWREALARPLRDACPDLHRDFADALSAVRTGESRVFKDHAVAVLTEGDDREALFDLSLSPLFGPGGRVDGMLLTACETTAAVYGRRREQFLPRLEHALRAADTVEDIASLALAHLREAFTADLAGLLAPPSPGRAVISAADPPNTSFELLATAENDAVRGRLVCRPPHAADGVRLVLQRALPFTSADCALAAAATEEVWQAIERVTAQSTLRDSESRYRELANSMPQLVWTATPEGAVDYWNSRVRDYAGAHVDADGELRWQGLMHPDDVETTARLWGEALAKGSEYQCTHRLTMRDGGHRWHLSRARPIRDAQGRVRRWYGTATDIHDLRMAEDRLRESEALARARADEIEAIYNAAPIGIVLFDRDFRFLRINARLAEFNGRSAQDHVGRSIEEVLPEETTQLLRSFLPRLLAGEEIYGLEITGKSDDGKRAGSYHVSYRPVKGADGEVVAIFGSILDISERKSAEMRLRDSEARQRIAAEAAGLGVFEWRVASETTEWENERMFELFGREPGPASIPNADIIERYVMPEDAERFRQTLQASQAAKGDLHFASRIRRGNDGALRWIEIAARYVEEAEGTPARYVGVVADVTEQRTAEAQRQLLIAELNHRVRNTLAVVQGVAHQTFRRGADPAKAMEAFQSRLAALAGAHTLLTQASWSDMPLRELAQQALTVVGAGPDHVSLNGPPAWLKPKAAVTMAMALHELCTNAVKYGSLSQAQGRVALEWRLDGPRRDRLHLVWRESGGPPVTPPTRRGFGSRMIEQALAQDLNGVARMDFRSEGLVCTIEGVIAEEEA